MLSVVFIFIFNHAERVWLSLFYLISLVSKIKCWNFTFLKTTDTLNVCISTCHITLGLYVYELMFMSRGRRHGGAMTVWRPRRLPSERALFEIVIQCCKRKTTAYFYWDITTCCDVMLVAAKPDILWTRLRDIFPAVFSQDTSKSKVDIRTKHGISCSHNMLISWLSHR